MKIRIGFVSNSSSSSFVIRGIRISTDVVVDLLKLKDKEEAYEALEELFPYDKGWAVHEDRNYFNHKTKPKGFIIGFDCGDMEDGEIYSSRDFICKKSDDQIVKKIKDELGLIVTELDTFVQYVSNDNC